MTKFPAFVASAAVLTLGGLGLSGCATTDYVDMKTAEVQAQVTSLADATNAKLSAHEAAIAKLNADVQAAQATASRAEAMHSQGKFVYDKVGQESVNFAVGSWKLSDEAKAQIDSIAARLKSANGNAYLEIEGFADSTGAEKRNRQLGLQRGYAVLDAFRDHGIALNRMNLFSHGEDNPAAANTDAAGRAENRRVVITVVQ